MNGKKIRGRQYPWGVVQVENENHCDFTKLREMLIRTNMEDLRDTTHSRHFEVYRCDKFIWAKESYVKVMSKFTKKTTTIFIFSLPFQEAPAAGDGFL